MGGQLQGGDDAVDSLLHAPGILGVDVALHLVELPQHGGGRLLLDQVVELLDEGGRTGKPVGHVVEHGLLAGVGQLLVKVGHTRFGLYPELAAVGLDLATQQLEEGRFAGTVAPEQAPAFTRLQGERDMIEQHVRAVGELDIVEAEQRHRVNG